MEKDRRSPEEVAQAGRMGYIDVAVSANTVYNYIRYRMKGGLKKPALKMPRLKGTEKVKRGRKTR